MLKYRYIGLRETDERVRDNKIAPIKSKTGKTRRRKVMDLKSPAYGGHDRQTAEKAKPPKDGDAKPGF